jgi:hypothetical protein
VRLNAAPIADYHRRGRTRATGGPGGHPRPGASAAEEGSSMASMRSRRVAVAGPALVSASSWPPAR